MRILLLTFLLLLAGSSQAAHIIGGVVTYECLGNGFYEFTMKMYRDCAGGGAGFDSNAPVSIYKGNSANPLTTLFISPQSIQNIDPDINDPCLILPPGICVQEAVYKFTYQFADWPSSKSYTLSYQRCCRNAGVANMFQPDDTGATFSIELTAASQALCNNSPVFETFPPIVICASQPIDFLHEATDAEGDQLIYSLCAPLKGGGPVGGPGNPGNANGCNGIVPNPACPPPYDPIDYIPPFNPLDPLPANPAMTINPVTGFISGVPTAQGQYVVGVCVEEYRNGQLLSVIRRDFQFNVASCEPVVFADIKEDSLLGPQIYLLRSCQGDGVDLVNESTLNPFQDDFYWQFEIDGSLQQFPELEPTISFPGPGVYNGMFLINPGSTACGDTAFVQVEIYTEPQADFSFFYDTCVAGPVFFIDKTVPGDAPVANWLWDFGDGVVSDFDSPTHIYSESGEKWAVLNIEDGNGCKGQAIKKVSYYPVPALILVSPDDTTSCPPATITFTNLSSPIDDTYQVIWDFGDGGVDTVISPVHTYAGDGLFSVGLEILSPIGCRTDTIFKDLISIKKNPIAGFYYSPSFISNLQPQIELLDSSLYTTGWDYFLNGKRIGPGPDLSYIMPDTGWQELKLIVSNSLGCRDTAIHWVDVVPEYRFFLPNAFTPNFDDTNDLFGGTGILPGFNNFRLQVWDRWGQLIFETDSPYEYWNGLYRNNGREAPDGVYVCLVSFTGPRGEPFEYKGFVTLMR
ncbi:MAG: gliding motility-associated C-terminal domain-containing protein [Lewinellaceae bacterium]|nr:gliding motility-associated C-terminal domain-containing protein [Lewinellaceae bacterium]